MDKVKQIADTLGLLSSMIYGGEEHSETSKKARHGAFLNLKALEAENAALKSSVLSEDEREAADYGIALVDKEISATFEYSQITGNKEGYDEALTSLKKMKTLRNLLSQQGNLERAKR
jgi:hypothetical protein